MYRRICKTLRECVSVSVSASPFQKTRCENVKIKGNGTPFSSLAFPPFVGGVSTFGSGKIAFFSRFREDGLDSRLTESASAWKHSDDRLNLRHSVKDICVWLYDCLLTKLKINTPEGNQITRLAKSR